MKYAVVLCDGMADYPVPQFDGATPMELAKKPNMDRLASLAEVGLCKTVPDGMKPGSDVANLSVMGFDPTRCYTGRSPLEAASIGIDLAETDVTLRCNLVTLSDEADYGSKTMVDYSGGDISTAEAAQLIEAVQQRMGDEVFSFHSGVQYRHCLLWHNGSTDIGFMTPPHDISGRVIGEYLNTNPAAAHLIDMMKRSVEILADHPVNKKRVAEGKRPANSVWFWGEGSRPRLDRFEDIYGLKGAVVSAVDLIRGIAKCADMEVLEVEGATGYIDTCFEDKTKAALAALERGADLVYMHFEAPDECGHRNEAENKVRSIELIDSRVLAPLVEGLDRMGEPYRILILPDHPTPIVTKTHASDPVPYLLYDSSEEKNSGISCFTEQTAAAAGRLVDPGCSLMAKLVGKEIG